jgi:hypothetical protein
MIPTETICWRGWELRQQSRSDREAIFSELTSSGLHFQVRVIYYLNPEPIDYQAKLTLKQVSSGTHSGDTAEEALERARKAILDAAADLS